MSTYPELAEWIEPDGLGGFASGTVSGRRTRRYHALLLTAVNPPTERFVLVNGAEVFVTTPTGTYPLSTQLYHPGVVHPYGHEFMTEFELNPWPTWSFRLPDGTQIVQDLFVPHERSAVVLRWRMDAGSTEVRLAFRPLMSGRDYHALHHENSAFRFESDRNTERVSWQPYPGVPGVTAISNGRYEHSPIWFRQFQYEVEAERGLDCLEDLASPGEFHWDLSSTDAVCILTATGPNAVEQKAGVPAREQAYQLSHRERDRRKSLTPAKPHVVASSVLVPSSTTSAVDSLIDARLKRSADAYIVRRGAGKTIIAGYPWFTDWGRDTFIALRGLCIATGRLDDAEQILSDWSGTVSEGMLPNRFPDHGDHPEFNSVDASLWFITAVHDFFAACRDAGRAVSDTNRTRLIDAIDAILHGYSVGTRFGIRLDDDGLLRAGEAGVQLTWMDAKVGSWVVTPRIGKPVEIQALWLAALDIGTQLLDAAHWQPLFERGRAAFRRRFWNETANCLFDVVDDNHEAGRVDASIRANQILAVGGLHVSLLEPQVARRVLDIVESQLLTPLGLRTLAPGSASYHSHYSGDVWSRDGAYHQGTVWPWLMGSFVSAWLRVHGSGSTQRAEAKRRFVEPLLQHLNVAGLQHVSEIADAEQPHTPRGCPFQAWSLGELIRSTQMVRTDVG